jgi:hypothetical protein
MGDALDLLLAFTRRAVIEHEDGAFAASEKLFQRKDFSSISGARLRQDLQLRDGIQRHATRIEPFHCASNPLKRIAQLDFGSMIDGVIGVFLKPLGKRIQLQKVNSVQRPAMRGGDIFQLFQSFGERHVKNALA